MILLPAVAWGYRFQRPQQLARALARRGHPVLYVDGFSRTFLQPTAWLTGVHESVTHLSMRIPGRPDLYREVLTTEAAHALGRRLSEGVTRKPVAIVVQLPSWRALGLELRRRLGAPLIYDRIDLHREFPGVPPSVEEAEDTLLLESDLVTATSRELARLSRRSTGRGEVRLLPNAVAIEDFPPRTPVPRPAVRVGLVGALNERIDVDAVRTAVTALPDWRFVLAGRVEDSGVGRLAELPNVELLGEIPHRRVPELLASLDIGWIPYRDTPLTRCIDPVKLYEMLAVGLPVVARRLPDTERWSEPCCHLYDDAEGVVPALLRAREDRESYRRARRRAAAENTWERRADRLLALASTLTHGRDETPGAI